MFVVPGLVIQYSIPRSIFSVLVCGPIPFCSSYMNWHLSLVWIVCLVFVVVMMSLFVNVKPPKCLPVSDVTTFI